MYWQNRGPRNTGETIRLALEKAKELNIGHVVVASSTGRTAEAFLNLENLGDIKVVCVTYHFGFHEPGVAAMLPETRQKLESAGINVLTTTHLMAGLDRALRFKFGGVYPAEIMANTLRMLGQGVKVCAEISGMALDAGLIPHGEKIIAIGGSGKGADSAVVITPAHSHHFFDTKVHEIICKPFEC